MKSIEENSQEKLQKEILKALKDRGQGADYAACSALLGALYEYYNSSKHKKGDEVVFTRIIAKLNDQYSDMWKKIKVKEG